MGIALGYAFLLAIAGGLIAICFAWLTELLDEEKLRASEREADRLDPAETAGFGARPASWHRTFGPQA
jgi:hypothetical protein